MCLRAFLPLHCLMIKIILARWFSTTEVMRKDCTGDEARSK